MKDLAGFGQTDIQEQNGGEVAAAVERCQAVLVSGVNRKQARVAGARWMQDCEIATIDVCTPQCWWFAREPCIGRWWARGGAPGARGAPCRCAWPTSRALPTCHRRASCRFWPTKALSTAARMSTQARARSRLSGGRLEFAGGLKEHQVVEQQAHADALAHRVVMVRRHQGQKMTATAQAQGI